MFGFTALVDALRQLFGIFSPFVEGGGEEVSTQEDGSSVQIPEPEPEAGAVWIDAG